MPNLCTYSLFVCQMHCTATSDNALNDAMKKDKTNYAKNIKMRTNQMFRKFCKAALFSNWWIHLAYDNRWCRCGSLDDRNFYCFAKYFTEMHLYVHHYNNTNPDRMVKSFKVIPLHNYDKRMAMIDTETMRKMRWIRYDKRIHNFNPPKSDAWSLFRLEGLEIINQWYDSKIMPDGMTTVIYMMKLNLYELHIDLGIPSKINGTSMRSQRSTSNRAIWSNVLMILLNFE